MPATRARAPRSTDDAYTRFLDAAQTLFAAQGYEGAKIGAAAAAQQVVSFLAAGMEAPSAGR